MVQHQFDSKSSWTGQLNLTVLIMVSVLLPVISFRKALKVIRPIYLNFLRFQHFIS